MLVLLAAGRAHAQSDVAPPLPNVMILLDTSGSMERFPNSKLPVVPSNQTSTEKNRWVQALEVLGGSIQGYSMLNQPRNGVDFFSEFNLSGIAPYDSGYYLSHYRVLSNSCTLGSNSLLPTKSWPKDWTTWGVSDFGFRRWSGASLLPPGSCTPSDFKTDGLGILDTFRDQARFALMTFDTLPQPETGWDGSSHQPGPGMTGQWSYFPGWNSPATLSPYHGWPMGCTVDPTKMSNHIFELGARNPTAPPWEGPLIPFAADDSTTSLRQVNDRIRYAMLAMRPYGATPLGPMLADAQHYLWEDPMGPKADPVGTCRGNFIILITDGFPNSDLRPNCEDPADPKTPPTQAWPNCSDTTKGCCPSKRPQDITYDLAHPPAGKPQVKTFVVGFALSSDSGTPVDCASMDPSTGICATISPTDPRRPCCTLHEMAYNGGTNKALLASDTDTLRAALVKAMSEATAATSTSRTTPVFTQATSSLSANGQYEFRSSFKVNPFDAWHGVLERIRWECRATTGVLKAEPQPIDKAAGDDFATNLNKQTSRTFFTIDATASAGGKSGGSIRPYLSSADFDGVTSVSGTPVIGSGSAFVSAVPAAALELGPTSCNDTASPEECKQKYLNYALALPQPKPTWRTRSSALGDIYHATPVTVGPPSDFLRDESYTLFRNANATRIPQLVTATNDGLLHSFKTTVTSEGDAVELWGFIPPAVLPHIGKQYGGAHALLLDAAPVVKDVAFGPSGSSTLWGRTRNDARGGTANWRTIAVGALTTGRGYYALDVTDPKNPKFLWQLTTIRDTAGTEHELFGTYPGTPAIGTVYYEEPGLAAIETPVAFLPGGEGTLNKTGKCNRWRTYASSTDPATTPRGQVRCWIGAGNSLTIVRLWDGKILRSFRNNPAGNGSAHHPPEPNSATRAFLDHGKDAVVTDSSGSFADIDSPLSGAVALYPAAPGSVTTRAFVGDYDGTLWKIDVADPKPRNWKIELFHDAYFPSDTANLDEKAWGPISTAPVLSVDRFGDIVVNYATGDQNNFSSTNLNHMYSVTERFKVVGGTKVPETKLNWHLRFVDGITPTGPMSLFSGSLFFSTFTPDVAGSNKCLKGQGTIWGVDYIETEPSVLNDDGTPVPMGRHKIVTSADASLASGSCAKKYPNQDARGTTHPFFRCINLEAPTIVFGAGITQRPSCVTTPTSAIGIDPYVGTSSTHQTVQDISQGEFQLVAQTGPSAKTSDTSGSATKTYVRTLVPPLSSTRIDSWAAIVE